MPPPPPPQPPLSGFHAVRLLGVGPVGEAWAGVGPDGERVVLRRLRPAAAGVAREHLASAAPTLQACAGLGFVRWVGLVPLGRDTAIATEEAAGGSLGALLRRQRVVAPALLAGVACSLAGLHEAGHPYGALTPSNVLVGADGVLLLDLDVSRLFGGLASAAHRLPYAEEGALSPAADVRALALLCRRALGCGLPRETDELLRAAVAATPSERPTAAELASALAVLPAGHPVPSRVARAEKPTPPQDRRPALRLVATVAAAVAAIGLAVGLDGRSGATPARRPPACPRGRAR